jgi:hypothetical protein
MNESYDESNTNESGPDSDEKTIPRSSLGYSHPREQSQRAGEEKEKEKAINGGHTSLRQPTSGIGSDSLDQILNEIRFDSLSNLLRRRDSSEDHADLISQWEKELTLLEDEEDEDEESDVVDASSASALRRFQDLETELLKTKSDLLSSQTSRTQMASHIDLLTSEISELKERSLAMVRIPLLPPPLPPSPPLPS